MQFRMLRLAGLGVLGTALLAVTAMFLLWPGPLALSDRVPVALLFGIPAGVVFYQLKRELA